MQMREEKDEEYGFGGFYSGGTAQLENVGFMDKLFGQVFDLSTYNLKNGSCLSSMAGHSKWDARRIHDDEGRRRCRIRFQPFR